MHAGDVQAYYRGALVGLRYAESREPRARRFGTDADLRWASFRGHLQDIDRLELLVRDADARWPGSLGARRVFRLEGVSEDDAFGHGWRALDAVAAAELWRTTLATPPPADLAEAYALLAASWKISLTPFVAPSIHPSTRLVVAGPSALVALTHAFVDRPELDFADQVAVVATDPGPRQLAAFASVALNLTKPTLILAADDPADLRGRALVVSEDASPVDAAAAAALVA